jgi:hypothetical protein
MVCCLTGGPLDPCHVSLCCCCSSYLFLLLLLLLLALLLAALLLCIAWGCQVHHLIPQPCACFLLCKGRALCWHCCG